MKDLARIARVLFRWLILRKPPAVTAEVSFPVGNGVDLLDACLIGRDLLIEVLATKGTDAEQEGEFRHLNHYDAEHGAVHTASWHRHGFEPADV